MLNFIVNAKSGKGRGFKNLKKIIGFCYEKKVEYTVHITSAQGHAERIAKALCEQQSHTIVAVGGDGTFHEVINGVAGYNDVAVGFIPSGRGNDYARAAKLHLNPIKALNDIVRGEIVHSDILSFGNRRCLNTAGAGMDVDVLKRVEGQTGAITYLVSLIQCLKNFSSYKFTVKADGKEENHECITVGICNGTCFGGGMKISPLSNISDGKMNVVIVRTPDDGKVMKALMPFRKGKHLDKPFVTHFTCEEVSVTAPAPCTVQLDGELYDNLPLDCKILKGELKTFKTSGK